MKFKEISFPGEDIDYIFVDEKQLKQLTFSLGKKVLNSGDKPDRMVALSKGGWTVARYLYGYLQPIGLKETATIGIGLYDGINDKSKSGPRIYQRLNQELEAELQGETVLVADDLTDSGEQLIFVKEYLESLGVARVIMVALFKKPTSEANIDHWAETTSAWIIFAYEAFETMEELDDKWRAKQIKDEEIKRRFGEIGFDQEDIDFYWQHRRELTAK